MLKFLNINTKCAEIHCSGLIAPKFSIICICGKSIVEYEEFCQHFYIDHLQDDKKRWNVGNQVSEEPPGTATTTECLEDPLLVLQSTTESPAPSESELNTLSIDNSWSEETPEVAQPPERRPYKPRNTPNMCTYCGRTFRRRYLLDTHLNIHTGRKPHQCDMCGKQFRAVSTLTRHLRTHEQRQEQQCKHCEKLFTHRSALLSHEMRHTQVRRWACASCGKCFYTRNQMDTHCRKLHARVDTATDVSRRLPFACELCGNSYRSASMLSTHKLKKHYRLAKFNCEKCDKKFVDPERLQQHQQIHVKPSEAPTI